jgi:hypothetical protein
MGARLVLVIRFLLCNIGGFRISSCKSCSSCQIRKSKEQDRINKMDMIPEQVLIVRGRFVA